MHFYPLMLFYVLKGKNAEQQKWYVAIAESVIHKWFTKFRCANIVLEDNILVAC